MKKESERATRPSQRPRRAKWSRPRLMAIHTADTEGGMNAGADGGGMSS